MAIYLSSFYPICFSKAGNEAIKRFNLPPFIDGSCRREPDFEKKNPAITGLCRPSFVKKLNKGDLIIYLTNKKGIGSRKIVAVLEVVEDKYSNHQEASKWYLEKGIDIPNNIMVKGTKPFSLDKTHMIGAWDSWSNKVDRIKDWDQFYYTRSKKFPKVVICKKNYFELYNPIELTDEFSKNIFGRVPGTQNPSIVNENEWKRISRLLGIN